MASWPTGLGLKPFPDWKNQILEGVHREKTESRKNNNES
jgi:hypothetical protein